jgi:hypothetical protein
MSLTPEQQAANPSTPTDLLVALAQTSLPLARIVAANPNADAELLCELSHSDDAQVLAGVAGNPNTPIDVLYELGESFPAAFLNNPAFTLLALENPAFFNEMPIGLAKAITQQTNVPTDIFIRCAIRSGNKNLLLRLLQQSDISQFDLEILTNYHDYDVAEAAKLHINLSEALPRESHLVTKMAISRFWSDVRLLHHPHNRILAVLAQIGLIPLAYVRELSIVDSAQHQLLQEIAQSAQTSPAILNELATMVDRLSTEVLSAMALNPNLPTSVAHQLLEQKSYEIWRALAKSHYPDILTKLAGMTAESTIKPQISLCLRRFSSALCEALGNGGDFILQRLLQDQPYLFDCLRQSAGTSLTHDLPKQFSWVLDQKFVELLQYVQKQGADRLRSVIEDKITTILHWHHLAIEISESIADNPHTPPEILAQLSQDKRAIVSGGSRREGILVSLISNPNAPQPLLEKVATTSGRYLRAKIAQHPNLSPQFLAELATDEESRVLLAVAEHPNTPLEIVENFIREPNVIDPYNSQRNSINLGILFSQADGARQPGENRQLRSAAFRNPSLPKTLLDQLAGEIKLERENPFISHPNASEELLTKQIEAATDEWTKQQIAKNLATPGYLLETILESSPDDATLMAIAKHPSAFESTLVKLSEIKINGGKCKYAAALSQNPRLPSQIRENLLRNDEISLEDLSIVLTEFVAQHPDRISLVLEYFSSHPSKAAQSMALRNPQVLLSTLEKGIQSLLWIDRYAVAYNPETPISLLENLAQDCNCFVRTTAQNILQSKLNN